MAGQATEHVIELFGLIVPDAGPVFLATLGLHVLAGLTAAIAGFAAAFARKRRGRHPSAGLVYTWATGAVFATATLLAAIRWREDAHLFVIGAFCFGLALTGVRSRRARWPDWERWHALAMAGSFVSLLTGFYVDNGPQLPGWRELPHWAYWVVPGAIGAPLTWRALRRYRASRPRGRTPGDQAGAGARRNLPWSS